MASSDSYRLAVSCSISALKSIIFTFIPRSIFILFNVARPKKGIEYRPRILDLGYVTAIL